MSGASDNVQMSGASDNAQMSGAAMNVSMRSASDNVQMSGASDNAQMSGAAMNVSMKSASDNIQLRGASDNVRMSGAAMNDLSLSPFSFLVGGSEGTRVQHPTTTTTKQKHTSEKKVFVLRSTGGPQNFEKFEDGHFDMSKECSVGASMPDYTNFPENA